METKIDLILRSNKESLTRYDGGNSAFMVLGGKGETASIRGGDGGRRERKGTEEGMLQHGVRGEETGGRRGLLGWEG